MVPQGPLSPATYKHSRVLDGIICLSVIGEIDLANAAEFSAQLKIATQSDGRGVILDLRELRYIDSSGIKVLLRAQETGRKIVLAATVPSVYRILTITGLDQLMLMFPTVEEALRNLR